MKKVRSSLRDYERIILARGTFSINYFSILCKLFILYVFLSLLEDSHEKRRYKSVFQNIQTK